ncbi:phytanoyl-CoA dioxygenase family protein [Actinokineospora bangkokensis]|uniref:phytanoyl-CoA dioxygenase family protein n=1 Tax=Actinokineospora bangkokensis TaxID=1193682 RepID=UPI001300E029|nr:phytanoyl-CoA dioxygenase family protein [Actinokineospora bangkokensis]
MDSTPIAADPDALRARVAEDGYVFLRGLLEPGPIRKTAHQVLAALQAEGWLSPDAEPAEAELLPPARDFKNANFVPGYARVQKVEGLHSLPHQPALTAVLRALVGDDVFCHPRKVARLVWPTGMGTTPGLYVHQDFVVEGVADMFTTWVPFVDCPPELGGLAVLTGSQNQGVAPRFDHVDQDDDRWATTSYRVGDVLLFHCLTAHGALPNRTSRLRLSADYRWQSAATPVPADALRPHLFGALPDWDELSAGWAEPGWVTPPAGVRTVERTGGEAASVPPSRFVTVPEQSPTDGEHVVLAGLFNNMRDAFQPARAAGRTAAIDYRITGQDGADHHWRLAVADGGCTVVTDPPSPGEVTISSAFSDYLRIVSGKLDPFAALSTGKLRIEGSPELAVEQLTWFRD